jgi:hypothetical protein
MSKEEKTMAVNSEFVSLVLRHTPQPCTAADLKKSVMELSGWNSSRSQVEIQRALDRGAIGMYGWRLVNRDSPLNGVDDG